MCNTKSRKAKALGSFIAVCVMYVCALVSSSFSAIILLLKQNLNGITCLKDVEEHE